MFKKGDILICIEPQHGLVYGRKYIITDIRERRDKEGTYFLDVEDTITGRDFEGLYDHRFKLIKVKKRNSDNYV